MKHRIRIKCVKRELLGGLNSHSFDRREYLSCDETRICWFLQNILKHREILVRQRRRLHSDPRFHFSSERRMKERSFEHPGPPHPTPLLIVWGGGWGVGGGDHQLARQAPNLPSSRQTKGMDAPQTECLKLARIKG